MKLEDIDVVYVWTFVCPNCGLTNSQELDYEPAVGDHGTCEHCQEEFLIY